MHEWGLGSLLTHPANWGLQPPLRKSWGNSMNLPLRHTDLGNNSCSKSTAMQERWLFYLHPPGSVCVDTSELWQLQVGSQLVTFLEWFDCYACLIPGCQCGWGCCKAVHCRIPGAWPCPLAMECSSTTSIQDIIWDVPEENNTPFLQIHFQQLLSWVRGHVYPYTPILLWDKKICPTTKVWQMWLLFISLLLRMWMLLWVRTLFDFVSSS